MTAGFERVTAKIYQFPINRVAKRVTLTEPGNDATRFSDLAFDSCWYHDEAVRDDVKPTRHD